MNKLYCAVTLLAAFSSSALAETTQVSEADLSKMCGDNSGCAYHLKLGFVTAAKVFASTGIKIADCPADVVKEGSTCLEVHMPGQLANRYHLPEAK